MRRLPSGHFFLPGPTEVRDEVLEAQNRPVAGHRGPEVEALMAAVQPGLRQLFGTERPVYVSTSSATGFMEAAIRNGVRNGVLCLVNGAFSERFAVIAEGCAREVDRFEVPWGHAFEPAEVAERVRGGGYDAVTLVHSETSTGALNPVAELAAAIRSADGDTLVLVDSVTGVGGVPMEADAWGLDFVLTGSQKALAAPPGLAFAVASERMLERAATVPGRGFYFDLLRFDAESRRNQTPTTPAVTLLYALEAQLAHIAIETLARRWDRHRAMAERTARWVASGEGGTGMSMLAPEGRRSPTVSCLVLPDGVEGPGVVRGLRERGWVIGGGYGKLKGTTVRIGHMGDHTPSELEALLEVLAEVLAAGRAP